MSEGGSIEPVREPEVIRSGPRREPPNLQPLVEMIRDAVNSLTTSRSVPFVVGERETSYEDLSSEDKRIVDATMDALKPDIAEKAQALLTAEIRDRIVRRGDFHQLEKWQKKGKKLFVKRKKGCIYIQLGTGDPDDPIEEFLVAMT